MKRLYTDLQHAQADPRSVDFKEFARASQHVALDFDNAVRLVRLLAELPDPDNEQEAT